MALSSRLNHHQFSTKFFPFLQASVFKSLFLTCFWKEIIGLKFLIHLNNFSNYLLSIEFDCVLLTLFYWSFLSDHRIN